MTHFTKKIFSLNSINFNIDFPVDISNYLDYYTVDNKSDGNDFNIISKIRFVKKFDDLSYETKISNTIFMDKNKSQYFFDGSLRITIHQLTKKEISSTIEIKELYLSPLIKILNFFRPKKRKIVVQHTQHNVVQALRHAILYPYFVMLNQKHNIAISHGSAFIQNEKTTVVVGFDGIGKSTLATIAKEDGATLITDNFVLYDNESLFFVPDPLRVLSENNNHAYGKKYEKIKLITEKVKNPTFIYTYLGKEYSFQKKNIEYLKKNNKLFWNFLPEFIDMKKYLTFLEIVNTELDFNLVNIENIDFNYYECVRTNLKDNKRMMHDKQKI